VNRIAALLLAASILAACAATVPATCDEQIISGARALSCDQVIAAARGQFATTPGITALVVEWGPLCPPNARCAAAGGDIATVFANLEDGSQLYVTVSLGPDGNVRVDAPQPVPSEFGP
jgi:hypothetical protein